LYIHLLLYAAQWAVISFGFLPRFSIRHESPQRQGFGLPLPRTLILNF
jgi:hypothetical protein